MILYESVPNVSCGKDESIINRLSAILQSVNESQLIHTDRGYDADRTVFTIVGSPQGLLKATMLLYRHSAELIDMRKYSGNHPAIGAVDVCPFIPLSDKANMKICKDMARQLAMQVASELNIPVFLYRESAKDAARSELSTIRRGGLVGLENRIKENNLPPDYGPKDLHYSFGATVIGARPILIAYNVNLQTNDLEVAKHIAGKIRESSSSKYALPDCRALGWFLKSKGIAQVSTNLTNYRTTGMHHVYEGVKDLASQEGVKVYGSEIVGLVPAQALVESARYFDPDLTNFAYIDLLSNNMELCVKGINTLGLNNNYLEHIIENRHNLT